jgi:hypothetical protein
MALGFGTNARLIAAFEATYGRFRGWQCENEMMSSIADGPPAPENPRYCLPHPFVKCLRRTANLLGNRHDSRPP